MKSARSWSTAQKCLEERQSLSFVLSREKKNKKNHEMEADSRSTPEDDTGVKKKVKGNPLSRIAHPEDCRGGRRMGVGFGRKESRTTPRNRLRNIQLLFQGKSKRERRRTKLGRVLKLAIGYTAHLSSSVGHLEESREDSQYTRNNQRGDSDIYT